MKKLINNNLDLIKQVGRVNGIVKIFLIDKNSIDILVLKEKNFFIFDEDVDLLSQKERIFQKIKSIKNQLDNLNIKLKNKAYIKECSKRNCSK